MPHCKHGRGYQWDVPLDCPECYREEFARQVAEETAYETLDATREAAEVQKQILQTMQQATLAVSSTPTGADIELDGVFVGSTPSTLTVGSGKHTIRITKTGYISWERKIGISSGSVSAAATLMIVPNGTATDAPGSFAEPASAFRSTDKAGQSATDSQEIKDSGSEESVVAKNKNDREREATERLDRLDQAEARKSSHKREEPDGEHAQKASSWTCEQCGELIENQFDSCWKCAGQKAEQKNTSPSDPGETDSEPVALQCPRCLNSLQYGGTKRFSAGALSRLFENYEDLDMYACSRCGRVEFFVAGIGERFRLGEVDGDE
jgi:rubrerythrin